MAQPSQLKTRAIVVEILGCRDAEAALEPKRHQLDEWAAAVNLLLDLKEFDAARYALRELGTAFRRAEFVTNLTTVLHHLPAAAGSTFSDDTTQEVQIARRDGADTAVIFFCGGGTHRLGMPLNAFHRWAAQMPASAIYLRDFREQFFLDGLPTLGGGLEASIAGLREVLARLNARRVLCYGFSVGGFAALFYGLRLGAARVVALGAAVTLEPEFNRHLRWIAAARRLRQSYPGMPLDLASEYAAAARAPRTVLVYGEHNWDDRLHAEYMASRAGAELVSLPAFAGHNPAIELIRRGKMQDFLARMCEAPGAVVTPA
jgi:hypothetical protein